MCFAVSRRGRLGCLFPNVVHIVDGGKAFFFLCSNRLHLRWINELTPARKGLPPTSRPFRWIPLPHHSPSLNPVRFRLDLLFVLISNWRTASCTLIEFDSVVMKTQFNLRLVQIFKFRNLHYVLSLSLEILKARSNFQISKFTLRIESFARDIEDVLL